MKGEAELAGSIVIHYGMNGARALALYTAGWICHRISGNKLEFCFVNVHSLPFVLTWREVVGCPLNHTAHGKAVIRPML